MQKETFYKKETKYESLNNYKYTSDILVHTQFFKNIVF